MGLETGKGQPPDPRSGAAGEPKETGEALRRAMSLLEAALESTADGILVVNAGGKISRYNRRFAEIWRLPPEVLDTGEDEKALAFVMNQLRKPEAFLSKVRELYSTPEASSFDVLELSGDRTLERYSIPQRLDGKVVGRVWSFRDVTARRRAEAEYRRLEAQVQHAQKLESLGVLAGGIAHDFNNILTAILGNADLALSALGESSPARPMLESIETSSGRAADLCRQMLAYSGRGQFEVKPTDLSALTDEMTPQLEASVAEGVTLRVKAAPGLSPVEADAMQLRQVVTNLMVNASEAIGESGGVVTVATGERHFDREYFSQLHVDDHLPSGRYVFLEVSDTGCGMQRAMTGRIFDPFFTTKSAGRGLGLAAVLGIVRGHRGAVRVYSEPGKGSTFMLLFPAAGEGSVAADAVADGAASWRGRGTVLLVDDEEAVREVGERMLLSAGFSVITTSGGPEAVEIARARASEIVCVVLDLTMPVAGGEEVVRALKRIAPHIPLVLSSGYNEQDATRRFARGELAGFVQKPYRRAALLAVLRQVLGG